MHWLTIFVLSKYYILCVTRRYLISRLERTTSKHSAIRSKATFIRLLYVLFYTLRSFKCIAFTSLCICRPMLVCNFQYFFGVCPSDYFCLHACMICCLHACLLFIICYVNLIFVCCATSSEGSIFIVLATNNTEWVALVDKLNKDVKPVLFWSLVPTWQHKKSLICCHRLFTWKKCLLTVRRAFLVCARSLIVCECVLLSRSV